MALWSPGEFAFTLATQDTPTGFGNNQNEMNAASPTCSPTARSA